MMHSKIESKRTMTGKKRRTRSGGRRAGVGAAWGPGSVTGGLNRVRVSNVSGQADNEYDFLRYETTSAFTATGGASSYLQIKANSIYRPYPGNTDSCGGYQRMYTQYAQSYVSQAQLEVRVWSATGTASQEPFRLIVIPCTSAQYTVYSGYTNVAALVDVPHAKQALFSPGGVLPRITSRCSTMAVYSGSTERGLEDIQTSNWWGTSGVDPSNLIYFLVGLQAMAGTTTLNCQIQVKATYWLKWRQPVATAVQQLSFWGNEYAPSAEERRAELRKSFLERDKTLLALLEGRTAPTWAGAQVDGKTEHKTSPSEGKEAKELPPQERPELSKEPVVPDDMGLTLESEDENLYKLFKRFVVGSKGKG